MILFVCYYKCFFWQNIFISIGRSVVLWWGRWTSCVLFSQFSTFCFFLSKQNIQFFMCQRSKHRGCERENVLATYKVNMMSHEQMLPPQQIKIPQLLGAFFGETLMVCKYKFNKLTLHPTAAYEMNVDGRIFTVEWIFIEKCHQFYISSRPKQFRLEKFVFLWRFSPFFSPEKLIL